MPEKITGRIPSLNRERKCQNEFQPSFNYSVRSEEPLSFIYEERDSSLRFEWQNEVSTGILFFFPIFAAGLLNISLL